MKRILFFTPVLVAGGAEKTIKNLIEYFKLFYPDYEVYESVMHLEDSINIPDYVIPLKNDTIIEKNFVKKLYKKIAQIYELRSIKKKYKIDYSISFLPGADVVNVLSRTNEKAIVSLRINPRNIAESSGKLFKAIYPFVVKRADYVVALSENVRQTAMEIYGIEQNKISTIYNPVPSRTKVVEPPLIKDLREKNEKIIITAGRLVEQKGQWHLLKALKEVNKSMKNVSLIVLGRGPLENALKTMANELELNDKVHFMGFVHNASDYIGSSDIFIFPSIYEGLGNVLIETIALGTAVISSDCPYGPREILAPGTVMHDLKTVEFAKYGVLVPCGTRRIEKPISDDETCLAEAIIKMLSDKDLLNHYKKMAGERAIQFAPGTIVKAWDAILCADI